MISINEKLDFFLLKSNFKHSKNHTVVTAKPNFLQGSVFKEVFLVC